MARRRAARYNYRPLTAGSLIWSGRHESSETAVSTFCLISNKNLTSEVATIWAYFWGQISMCTVNAWSPPMSCRPLARSRGFHAAWLKQRSPDRSITNLHSQQSVTDSMPTKPLAIHYWEAVQGEARLQTVNYNKFLAFSFLCPNCREEGTAETGRSFTHHNPFLFN